jgi:hypothetical protein
LKAAQLEGSSQSDQKLCSLWFFASCKRLVEFMFQSSMGKNKLKFFASWLICRDL